VDSKAYTITKCFIFSKKNKILNIKH
jgi:hypothetical protein